MIKRNTEYKIFEMGEMRMLLKELDELNYRHVTSNLPSLEFLEKAEDEIKKALSDEDKNTLHVFTTGNKKFHVTKYRMSSSAKRYIPKPRFESIKL